MMRIKDSRSFLGALAFLVVGSLISLANLFYFYIDYFGNDIFMSRWWWELVLNLQILCFASTWYAHHERLTADVDSAIKRRSILYFCMAMFAVSAPIVLLIFGVFTDWFRQLTVRPNVIAVHYIFISIWIFSAVILLITRLRGHYEMSAKNRTNTKRLKAFCYKYWPGLLMLFLMLLGELVAYDFVYVLTPFLGYLQIAMPNLRRAFEEPRS